MKPTRSWLFSRNSTVRDRHNDVRLDEIVAMPEQVPLLLIGRLAVDAQYRGQGIGSALLADSLRRCLAASEIAGARAVIAHAIDDAAARFYERHGFIRSPLGERHHADADRNGSVADRQATGRAYPWQVRESMLMRQFFPVNRE